MPLLIAEELIGERRKLAVPVAPHLLLLQAVRRQPVVQPVGSFDANVGVGTESMRFGASSSRRGGGDEMRVLRRAHLAGGGPGGGGG